MSQYYLMAQLPSLDGLDESAQLPITVAEFYEICARFLDEQEMETLRGLSLIPPREIAESGSALVDAWNREERDLRLALGSVRASRMKKQFDAGAVLIPAPLLQTARTAAEQDDPMAAERVLGQHRLAFLEQLRPVDGFCGDAVFYYALKLMLLERMHQFDTEKGWNAYRNMYDSILHGDSQENE